MYEALKSFGGIISMTVGDKKEIADDSIANDLLRAGYIREVCPAKKVQSAKGKRRRDDSHANDRKNK